MREQLRAKEALQALCELRMFLRVLWTKQLTRKSKTWHDGILEVTEERGSRAVVLFTDERCRLASGRIPASLEITEDLEGMPC